MIWNILCHPISAIFASFVRNNVVFRAMRVWTQHLPVATKPMHTTMHTAPEQVISWTERSQLWITASNERGNLSETEGKSSARQHIWLFNRRPSSSLPTRLLRWLTPTEISTGDVSRSHSDGNSFRNWVVFSKSESYKYSQDIYNILSETIRGKKCSSVEFAGRYALKKHYFPQFCVQTCKWEFMPSWFSSLKDSCYENCSVGSAGASSVGSLSRSTPNALAGFCAILFI